jgi:dTDP-4-dehydrorhamnose 3,5-epimerase
MTSQNELFDGIYAKSGEIFLDERGYFYEKYNHQFLIDKNVNFFQENISKSKKGTIRGLHWQTEPNSQDKLVTCITGQIYDVVVDLRRSSKTFGQYCSIVLNEFENTSLWIPKGFAHGFQALTDNCIISYSVSGNFSKDGSQTINPLCPTIKIAWPIKNFILSDNDSKALNLSELSNQEIFF